MYYVASGTIATEHPELAGAVRGLDEFLFRNDCHPIRLDITADILGVNRDQLARLIDLFARHGVVGKVVGYVCPGCDGLIELVPEQHGLLCDECETTVNFRGRGTLGVTMWRPLATAERTGATLPDVTEGAPLPEQRERLCIQFVGGDRGGAGRPQVMLPREEKLIRDAISLGKFRDGFAFAASVYAASLDDLIGCHRSNPGVMHFAGHGDERGLIVIKDRDLITQPSTLDLGQLIVLFGAFPKRVRLVFFNTCDSSGLAKGLAESGAVDLAIGVPGRIADDPAIDVAKTFYRQVADGLTVQRAFTMAGLMIKNAAGAVRHELFSAPGTDPGLVSFGW